MIICGEVTETLRSFQDNSFDAVFCDPPYGLSFMGNKWDYDVPSVALWQEVLRVCKPGAALLAFGGTRTYHRMVVNIEDAGWEIRDQLAWIYGSGFPKSHDVSKALDKGHVRKIIGEKMTPSGKPASSYRPNTHLQYATGAQNSTSHQSRHDNNLYAPTTDLAKEWNGYGTALKPAHEPIVLARKPLEGTVAKNVAKWGCGALAIDATRVGTEEITINRFTDGMKPFGEGAGHPYESNKVVGRWPANVILDEIAGEILDEQSGNRKGMSGGGKHKDGYAGGMFGAIDSVATARGDSGGASRFFYCAKANKRERGLGNTHPTVKPTKLTAYLSSLIKPPTGGKILIPFSGSGSEIIGALDAGWLDVTGIELDPDYVRIAESRIASRESRRVS